jgi:hypothetical protein
LRDCLGNIDTEVIGLTAKSYHADASTPVLPFEFVPGISIFLSLAIMLHDPLGDFAVS